MDDLDGFSLLLVDDHPLFREGLALALAQRAPALAICPVASLELALQALRQEPDRFDLVLLDYRLPGKDGLQCAVQLRHEFPGVACALMSGSGDPELAERARAAGMVAYLPKSLEVERLVDALHELAQGRTYFVQERFVAAHSALTLRQQEIVRLAAQGASNKEIAQALGIAPHTVKNHLAQIFEKLGASNRAQAVALAQGQPDGVG